MRLRATGLPLALALAIALPREVTAAPAPDGPDPASVYRIWPWADGAAIVAANGVTLGLYLGVNLHPSCPCDPRDVNALDRHAIGNHSDAAFIVGTATVAASIAAPLVLDIADLRSLRPVVEDATVLVEALSVSGALATIAKFGFHRPYPRTYAGDPQLLNLPSAYRSFYSGHTTLTFTGLSVAAMTVGRRYHLYAVPWIVTVLVGSSVALEMVWSGWHFPTDVITGALMGTAVGVAVPALHFEHASARAIVMASADGSPLLGLAGTWR